MKPAYLPIPIRDTHIIVSTDTSIVARTGFLIPFSLGCKIARPEERMPVLIVGTNAAGTLWAFISLN